MMGFGPPTSLDPRTSLDVLKEMDTPKNGATCTPWSCKDTSCGACGAWGRSEIINLRDSAMGTKSIFSFCFVVPMTGFQALYGVLMLILAVIIQVAVPLIIIATGQPIEDIDANNQACPNQSGHTTKFVGLILSLYFVVQTISLCLNKLRGLGFLVAFVDLGFTRSLFIKLAILSQFAGMAAAGGAQFLLFVGNADGAFIVLVLQSLAMTFCLTVDQNLVGHLIGTFTSKRLAAVSRDPLLCGGRGVGMERSGMPGEVFEKVKLLVKSEEIIIGVIATTGVAWSIALTYCM